MGHYTADDLIGKKLEELTQQCADHLFALTNQPEQGHPTVKDETRFYRAQYNAFNKALGYWMTGVRPIRLPSGAYLIPSGSRPGAVKHQIHKQGHIWICGPSCEATSFHWHNALMAAYDALEDAAAAHDDYPAEPQIEGTDDDPFLPDFTARLIDPPVDDPTPPPWDGRAFGARLARARRQLQEAA